MIKYQVYCVTSKRTPIVHLTDEHEYTFCHQVLKHSSRRKGLFPTCFQCVARLDNIYADEASGLDVVLR